MKHVAKQTAPALFDAWKAKASEDWRPAYADLQKPEKRALHEALLAEQGWVCCYCGRVVSLSDSHIEHFRPQSQRDDLALDYGNLHASCIRETTPITPLHCGHAKGDLFDEALALSPADQTCEGRFSYTLLGEVLLTDSSDERAHYMRSLLRLDIPFLRSRREEALRRTFDTEFLGSATDAELRILRDAFQRRDAAGRSSSFGHVIARYAEQRLADAES